MRSFYLRSSADGNSPLGSEGVPYVLESDEVQGKDKKYVRREKELPLENQMVRF